MLRLAKFAFVLASVLGASCPSASEAGVIPWAYDAVFGPVGSLRGSNYTPYYAGYSGYTGASYQPAAYSTGYATNGCSSCQQSSYYASAYDSCGCSPCGSNCSSGGCASGNCASGNCTTNSVPTDGLSPVADPNNHSRGTNSSGIESRLEAIEKQLNILPPRDRTRTYDPEDKFTPRTRTQPNDGLGSGNSVPARRRPAGGTVVDDENFTTPNVRNPAHGTTRDPADDLYPANPPARTGTDGAASGARETFKPNTEKLNPVKPNTDQPASDQGEAGKSDSTSNDTINAPDPDLVIPARKPATTGTAIEGSNRPLTLDSRITSRAVSPRERQVIAVGFQKSVVASTKPVAPAKAPALSKTAAPAKNWAGNTKSTDLAQHR